MFIKSCVAISLFICNYWWCKKAEAKNPKSCEDKPQNRPQPGGGKRTDGDQAHGAEKTRRKMDGRFRSPKPPPALVLGELGNTRRRRNPREKERKTSESRVAPVADTLNRSVDGWKSERNTRSTRGCSLARLGGPSSAAAATLQKPLPYRLYPPMILAGPSNPLGSLTASSSLSTLSNYYRDSPEMADGRDSSRKRDRSKSPESRDRSPTRKPTRLYPLQMMQAGPSNPLGTLTTSNLSNMNNYYRGSPELMEGRENMDRSRKQERSSNSPDSRDRSPMRKDVRSYPSTMIQAGPSNPLGPLAPSSNLNNYYRDSPEIMDGREGMNRTRQRDRSQSQDRSPVQREDSPRSVRADSDEESIHDI